MPHFWILLLLTVAHSRSFQGSNGICETHCNCQTEFRFTNCSDALFTYIPSDIPLFTEHLDLSQNRLSLLPSGAFRMMRRLKVLLLNDNNISHVAGGAFSTLESLQRLDLSRNRISALREGFSLGLASLKELQLGENWLTSVDRHLHLDNLYKLNLSANLISSIRARAFGHMTALRQLYLQDNCLVALTNGVFSMLRSLEVLQLEGNHLNSTEAAVFTPLTSLSLLSLSRNSLTGVRFKTFLNIHSHSTHILLADNPWACDCDLQRVFRKLRSVQRLFLDDFQNLTCAEPAELRGYRLSELDSGLCIAETVTVLIISITVLITVVAAVVMAEKTRKKQTGKHLCEESSDVYQYQSSGAFYSNI